MKWLTSMLARLRPARNPERERAEARTLREADAIIEAYRKHDGELRVVLVRRK